MDNSADQPPVLRRLAPQGSQGASRRSVKFSAVPSSAVMKAIMNKMPSSKTKTPRRASRMTERSFPKLVFDYGPTTYRGLLLHRKIKLAPFAELFQQKYPQIRVYYHPISTYNVVAVRLKECIVVRMLLSNVAYSTNEDITKNSFYKLIDQAIQRMIQYPNLLTQPFRDAVCLMTHNLDIDYDVPWYRTEFPRKAPTGQNEHAGRKLQNARKVQTSYTLQSQSSESSLGHSSQTALVQAAPCLVDMDGPLPGSIFWKKFLRAVEGSPEFDKMLKREFSSLEELEQAKG